jgi:hypothetical protein
MSPEAQPRRRSRYWLFAPFVLLALLAAGWTAVWFVIRARTAEGLDSWLANESVAGRRWECPERAIGGYPFRIEVACARVSLQSRDLTLAAGRLSTVTQIYQPRHTIAELEGPLRVAGPGVNLEGNWVSLRASIHRAPQALQRASLVVEDGSMKASGLPFGDLSASGRRFEAHLRPAASPQGESAFDIAASAAGASVPILDPILGGTEPLDAELQLVATQARIGALRRDEIERWREAGGRILVNALSLAKGPRRLEAKGELALDDLRRPTGRVDVAAAGLRDLLATITGGRMPGAAGGVLGSLLQPRNRQFPSESGAQAAGAKLTPLPPIRLENGRVLVGPFTVPGLRLAPLY